jgi:hypothetical protein
MKGREMNESQVEPLILDKPTLRRVVAGAIYDFAGKLTSRDKAITFGGTHDCAPVAEACNEFLKERNCLDGEPMVRDWQDKLPKLEGVPAAMSTVIAEMKADYSYAWSWHCVAACCAMDEGLNHEAANRAAARLMKMAFDVDTSGGHRKGC